MSPEKEGSFSPEQPKEEGMAKPAPEKAELKDLHERLGAIIRTISEKPNLEVTTEFSPGIILASIQRGMDPGERWYRESEYDPKTRELIKELVHIPPKILETSENIALGKSAHEAAHVAITRFDEFIPDAVLQELGFHSLLLAAEERPTDQVVRERYSGAGKWVDEARKDSALEGTAAAREAKNQGLGYKPKFAQLCDLVVYEPHLEQIPADYDPEVVELYQGVRGEVEEMEKTLPAEGSSPEEVRAKAIERYKIVYSKIWPEAQKLVEEDLKNEELRQMVKEGGIPLDQLPPDLREELESAVERGEIILIPMESLSENLKNALEKVFDELPKEKKEGLSQKARQALEELEDALVEELSGKLLDAPPETHAEYRERKKEEGEKARLEKELKDIERHQAALLASKSEYDQAYEEVKDLDEELYRRLEEIFTPNIKRKTRLVSTGAKLNLPAVFKWEAGMGAGASTVDSRIFETVRFPEKKDYAFTMLVDLSGSMRGEKVKETFKATVLLTEVLNRLGVKNEILGFQDEVIIFKSFDGELDDEVRRRMAGMKAEVSGENPGGHNEPRFNDDGPCLLEASKGLGLQPNKEKFLLVLSDGIPAGRRSTSEDLTRAVEKILQKTEQKLVGFGVGPETGHVKEFYPASVPNLRTEELPQALGALLEDTIQNPGKYRQRSP